MSSLVGAAAPIRPPPLWLRHCIVVNRNNNKTIDKHGKVVEKPTLEVHQ